MTIWDSLVAGIGNPCMVFAGLTGARKSAGVEEQRANVDARALLWPAEPSADLLSSWIP